MSSARERETWSPPNDLVDKTSLGFECLPHERIEALSGYVTIDRHFLVMVALAENAAVALLDLGRFPGRIEMMQRRQAFLHIGAGAHLLGAAQQHAHRALPDFLKEALFLGVGLRLADRGDLLGRNAVGDELLHDVVVGRITPRRGIDPHVGKDELRAARRGGITPNRKDVLDQPIDFRLGKVGRGRRQHPCIGGELAAVSGDVERVIDARVYLLRPQAFVAFYQFLLDGALLLGHGASDDNRLTFFQTRPWQIEHLGRLHVGKGAEHLLKLRQVGEARRTGFWP